LCPAADSDSNAHRCNSFSRPEEDNIVLLGRTIGALVLIAGWTAIGCNPARPAVASTPSVSGDLGDPAAFAGIRDPSDRSRALFLEASRVLLHPRCTNCHPDGDSPYQGTPPQLHDPPVTRGPDGLGVVGMQCNSCHQDKNLELARVPGAPNWHLAPREMAWVGKTAGGVCQQLKDRKRNGGRTLEQIVDHSAHDELVSWGWNPGWAREPAPGTQVRFGALLAEWLRTGAQCPR
jgi:hypothetical protein